MLIDFEITHCPYRESCVGFTLQDIFALLCYVVLGLSIVGSVHTVLIISELHTSKCQTACRQTACSLHTKHKHNTSAPHHLSNYMLASLICYMLGREPC